MTQVLVVAQTAAGASDPVSKAFAIGKASGTSSGGLSTGAIIGLALAFAILIIIIVYLLIRQKKRGEYQVLDG